MNGERTILNELRLINIALKRGISSFCDSERGTAHNRVPSVAHMVLHFISMQGGSVLQKDVENEFNLRRSTASELMGRLEQDGYITRKVEENDARVKRIHLSDKAKAEQKEISDKFCGVEAYIKSALTERELETFFELCDKIRKRIETQSDNVVSESLRGGDKV